MNYQFARLRIEMNDIEIPVCQILTKEQWDKLFTIETYDEEDLKNTDPITVRWISNSEEMKYVFEDVYDVCDSIWCENLSEEETQLIISLQSVDYFCDFISISDLIDKCYAEVINRYGEVKQ